MKELEFRLDYCDKCMQMTNHIGNECQKCKAKKKKTSQMEFEVTAVLNDDFYNHFGIHPSLASLYGDKIKDIETLIMKISKDQTIPKTHMKEADYWGWFNAEKNKFTMMIYAQRFLLEMCFSYGIKEAEDAGQGKAYRIEIVETRDYKLE